MIFQKNDLAIRLELNGQHLYEITAKEMPAEIIIGRASGCTWTIPAEDRGASGKHAKLVKKGSTVFLRDLESRNGVFFMESKIVERKLSAGEIYTIGDCKLIVEHAPEQQKKQTFEFNRLEQLSGSGKGQIHSLKEAVINIGSDESCEIQIKDPLISHLHAVIENHPDGTCWIKDNKSRNGTKVNGTPLTEENAETGRMLKDGDILSIAYIDFRFWDKNVVHVRSHLLLKIGIVAATIAIVIGGYFAVQTIFPSAKTMRLRAERLAAAGNFNGARELLTKALDARGAENDVSQRKELNRKLNLWQNTAATWYSIRKRLADNSTRSGIRKANALFASLLSSDNENWTWNASASASEMKNAQETHNLLSALLAAEDRISNSEEDFSYLKSLDEKLKKAVAVCENAPADYRTGAITRAKDISKEINALVEEHNELQKIMERYSTIEQTDSIVAAVRAIREKSQKRYMERRTNHRSASRTVVLYCDALLEPLELLNRSAEELKKNMNAVAMFQFSKQKHSLPLPTPAECMISANLSSRRAEMELRCERFKKIAVHLKNFERFLIHNGISPENPDRDLDNFFSDSTWEKVLACDCLNSKLPAYSARKPSSTYDRMIGIYAFFEYLRSLDGEFDTTIFDERFKPEVFRARELFSSIETFNAFCSASPDKPFAEEIPLLLAVNSGENTLSRYRESVSRILSRRNALIRNMIAAYQKAPSSRRGILAGGIALALIPGESSAESKKLRKSLNKSFIDLRRSLAKKIEKNKDLPPEQVLRNERALLAEGIPGDPFLKQPWTDRFGGVGK